MFKFINDHFQPIMIFSIVSLIIVIFGWEIAGVVFPKTAQVSKDVIGTVIGEVIDEKIKPLAEAVDRIEKRISTENDYSVILMSLEMRDMVTAEEVNSRIDFLEENRWMAQIAAIEYLSRNPDAVKALKDHMIYEEAYNALRVRINRY